MGIYKGYCYICYFYFIFLNNFSHFDIFKFYWIQITLKDWNSICINKLNLLIFSVVCILLCRLSLLTESDPHILWSLKILWSLSVISVPEKSVWFCAWLELSKLKKWSIYFIYFGDCNSLFLSAFSRKFVIFRIFFSL